MHVSITYSFNVSCHLNYLHFNSNVRTNPIAKKKEGRVIRVPVDEVGVSESYPTRRDAPTSNSPPSFFSDIA